MRNSMLGSGLVVGAESPSRPPRTACSEDPVLTCVGRRGKYRRELGNYPG